MPISGKAADGGKTPEKPRHAVRAARLFSMPEDCLASGIQLELHGGELFLSGYEALLLYEDAEIRFRVRRESGRGSEVLRICGAGLVLSALQRGCVRVTGRIDAVFLRTPSASASEGGL